MRLCSGGGYAPVNLPLIGDTWRRASETAGRSRRPELEKQYQLAHGSRAERRAARYGPADARRGDARSAVGQPLPDIPESIHRLCGSRACGPGHQGKSGEAVP